MNRILLSILSLLMLPEWVIASGDGGYDFIRTLDTLLVVLDEGASEYKFTDQGMAFTHFYSSELNQSFIVSDELGEVCSSYEGSDILSCFPCEEGEVSEVCP